MIVTEYDAPIFKVLANNDTGASLGHQGGFVLPKELEDYLPLLRNQTTVENPTVDVSITADLFDGSEYRGTVESRYQYQTWRGARSPERRITRNLGPLLNGAQGGDILILERGIEVEDHYRFTLIRQENPIYGGLIRSFNGVRWGAVNPEQLPAKETEVLAAGREMEQASAGPFALFDDNAPTIETRTQKVARGKAFKRLISAAYVHGCAFCRGGLQHPNGGVELEASHIVSRSLKGSDDVRNGLLLCRSHHWAFDSGLIGVTEKLTLFVPDAVQRIARNEPLARLHEQEIGLPIRAEDRPALQALAWHRENILFYQA